MENQTLTPQDTPPNSGMVKLLAARVINPISAMSTESRQCDLYVSQRSRFKLWHHLSRVAHNPLKKAKKVAKALKTMKFLK
jgi:hypothetical protein